MKGFNVTFERYFPHDDSEDVCEPDERGFVIENATLREALNHCAMRAEWARADSADEWPIRSPRWFDFRKWNEGTREAIERGIQEDRALHVPDNVTQSSRLRIARFLGLKTN